jgi:hypothetical protein
MPYSDPQKAKEYIKEYMKQYRVKNRTRLLAWEKARSLKNRERYRNYRIKNIEKIAERRKRIREERWYSDVQYKLACALRTRLGEAIKSNQKSGSAIRDLGCTIPELKRYIESRFEAGMTWKNWSKDGWHLDHEVPLAAFNLSDPVQFKYAVHYSNLQPMWAIENIRKGYFV